METPNAFLNFACNKNYEFSSLRRAKFSTMALLYELHTSTTERFRYYCNRCRQQCDTCYYCTVCDDFNLCEKCYNIQLKHQHQMELRILSIVRPVHVTTYLSGRSYPTLLSKTNITNL
jgi:E1A/CREB-binding protein